MANETTTNQAMNGAFKLTGAALTEAREALGMTQAVAARIMGVSGQSMSSWESERVKPWGKNAEKITNFILASRKAVARRSGFRPIDVPSPVCDEPELELELELEADDRGPAQQFIAKRHTRDDLRFMGWKLAEAEGQSANGADCVATLYQTQRGTFVVEIRYVISGRCFSTFGERDYLLEKTPMEWVADLIRENTEIKYVDLD